MTRQEVEEKLKDLPLLETAWLKTDQVIFSESVRSICRQECPRYGTSWSCPPAVGTVRACALRCRGFSDCFVFSTVAEVTDPEDMEEVLGTRGEHERITRKVRDVFREGFGEVLTLSTESCDLCPSCSYPDAPCRQPDRMFPCVESYGILVTDLAEKGGMTFQNGAHAVTWFSVIFFHVQAMG